jgi:hypothetical protein
MAIAAVFAGLTTLLVVLAFTHSLFLFVVAVPFAGTTYFLWYHASGRLDRRTFAREARGRSRRRRAAGDGGFGAGARRAAAEANRERARRTATGTGPSRAEAYRRLDLDPDGAVDADDVRRAYREKVKDVHPDRGGDEEAFKRVTRAYERLSDDR